MIDFAELGHPEQPLLKKAPLVLTMCQLRFPSILGFSDELVRPVQVALGKDYPEVEVQALQQVQFGPGGVTVTGEAQRLFRFHAHDRTWVVSVGPTALSLETQAYSGFRDFAERWQAVASACIDALSIAHQERIGLRYINELPSEPGAAHKDLRKLVRDELLCPIGAHETTRRVIKSWQELRFAQDDGSLTLQHGYGERPPNGWAYVLDFDHYDDQGQLVDLDAQLRCLAGFNHRIYQLFEWAVDENLFQTFEPEAK